MSKVVVAGGGVVGLCTAYYLQGAGHQVTVIDKGDIRSGTSFGNAGYVSPSHFIPLASPGIVAKGLKWMLSATSPFYIKPRLNLDLIRWCLTFWKSSGRNSMEKNIPPLNEILHLSRDLTLEMKKDLGDLFDLTEVGCFMLYKNATTEKHEIELAKEAESLRIETRIYNGREVQDLEPEVEVKVRGGVLYPIDCHLNPGKFMSSLYQYLKDRGVKFELNNSITGFEKEGRKINKVLTEKGDMHADEVVLSTGSWLSLIGQQLGIDLLMQAGKGYSMTFSDVPRNLRHPAILVDHRVAMTPMAQDLRMGGTMEISGLDSPMLKKRAEAIFNAAKLYYPDLPVSFPSMDKVWFGLRPLSPDGLPYIGRHSKYENLVIAGGHAMLGISLAAATGKLVKEIVGQQPTSMDISAFNVERFN